MRSCRGRGGVVVSALDFRSEVSSAVQGPVLAIVLFQLDKKLYLNVVSLHPGGNHLIQGGGGSSITLSCFML